MGQDLAEDIAMGVNLREHQGQHRVMCSANMLCLLQAKC